MFENCGQREFLQREAAAGPDVVRLNRLGADQEHVVDERNGHQRGHDQRDGKGGDQAEHDDARAHSRIRRGQVEYRDRDDRRQTKVKPCSARETQEQAARQERHCGKPEQRDAACQKPDHEQQQRIDQKRPVDVRIFERPAGASIEQKKIEKWQQMEKSDIAPHGRDHRGENIGAPHDRQPHQVAAAE